MRFIPIEEAKEGMCLYYDVFDSYGRNLVSAKSILSQAYIEKLILVGIHGIYIDDELTKDIVVEPVINPILRAEGLKSVRERDIEKCKEVAKSIVYEMLNKGTCSLDMSDLRSFDDYTYAHSVNVAVLSCTIGLGLNLNEDTLINLVLSALLHDLGKLEIPPEILNKPSRLTQEEYQIMKTHSTLSYDLIKDRIDISAQVKHAVLCHHENVDGSGYPNGLSAHDISLISRILHVADVYDALISTRPYKKPFSPIEAIEYLNSNIDIMFDPTIVYTFINYIPFYPKASCVTLSTGQDAIVVENTGIRNIRPLVRLLDGTDIDLSDIKNKDISIVLNDDDNRQESIEQAEKERKSMIQDIERRHIIYICENPTNENVLREHLQYLYDLTILKSSYQYSLYINKAEEPDLLIIDVDMKDNDGYKSLSEILENRIKKYPVVILSENRSFDVVMKFKQLDVKSYILKPFHVRYLKSELDSLLFNTKKVQIEDI